MSRKAKEELGGIVPNNRYDALAELSAAVRTAGSLRLSGGESSVELSTDNPRLPELLASLCLTLMLPPPVVSSGKHITLTFAGGRDLLVTLGIFRRTSDGYAQEDGLPTPLVRRDSEKRAYVRGAFLGAGFLSAGKNNHMEWAFASERLRDDFALLLPSAAGKGMRDGRFTVYLKSKEKISDALVFMGATKAALELQEEMLLSSIGRRANAAQNCDVANIDRAVDAAARQVRAIETLDRTVGLESLDARLQTTAILRRTYPEANMSELAEMLGVSKSCVKHRLEKLIALSRNTQKGGNGKE